VDVLGIDVSKADFHAYLIQDRQDAKKSFPNVPAGFRQVQKWLTNRRCTKLHACMEATGPYWEALATARYDAGIAVSVVNPSQTVFFARSQLRRTKTDAVDAQMTAQFCQQRRPDLWAPPPTEIRELRGLLRYREHLVGEAVRLEQMIAQIHVSRNLRKVHAEQLRALKKAIAMVGKQLQALVKAHSCLAKQIDALTVVSGVGTLTALSFIAKLPVDRPCDGKAAAAYVGLAPSERQSGASVHGKPRICKTGNASLRRDMYMPAMAAIRHNQILRAFAERLKARGKPAKVVLVAVMRKLIVLTFTILKQPSSEALAV